MEVTEVDLRDLHATSVLGRGAKGVVFHVTFRDDQSLAFKAISKSFLRRQRNKYKNNKKEEEEEEEDDIAYRRIWFERDVLSSLHHPLLPSLRAFVSTPKIIGYLIPCCPGGNLTSLRLRQSEQMFSDDVIKFYAAEMVLALEHLHSLGIVYRDLKPENILIQDSGHIMLVDFDLSVKLPPGPDPAAAADPTRTRKPDPAERRKQRRGLLLSCFSGANSTFVSPEISDSRSPERSGPGKSNSFVGTEEYVAPEIIRGDGHDRAVDWWSLGVVLYEMLYGRTPFRGQNRKETFYRILTKEAELVGERTALRDLIGRLLEKDAGKRIGCEGIKGHEFFGGVVWEEVLRVSRPPYIPVGVEWEEGEYVDVEQCVEEVFGDGGIIAKSEEGGNGNLQLKSCDFDVF